MNMRFSLDIKSGTFENMDKEFEPKDKKINLSADKIVISHEQIIQEMYGTSESN